MQYLFNNIIILPTKIADRIVSIRIPGNVLILTSNKIIDKNTTVQSKHILTLPKSNLVFILITWASPSGATGTIFAVIVNTTPTAVHNRLTIHNKNMFKTIPEASVPEKLLNPSQKTLLFSQQEGLGFHPWGPGVNNPYLLTYSRYKVFLNHI